MILVVLFCWLKRRQLLTQWIISNLTQNVNRKGRCSCMMTVNPKIWISYVIYLRRWLFPNTNTTLRSVSPHRIFCWTYFDVCRFPIADLRKDPSQRLAWWRRNLRQEVLELQLSKPQFRTKLGGASTSGSTSELEFTCRSVRGMLLSYKEKLTEIRKELKLFTC